MKNRKKKSNKTAKETSRDYRRFLSGKMEGLSDKMNIEIERRDELIPGLNIMPRREHDKENFDEPIKVFDLKGYFEILENERVQESLKIVIDQGSASDSVVSEILAEVSVLYRMAGGSGINFEFDEILTLKSELA